MKNKLLIAILVVAMAPLTLFSQIDITPTYGYNFGAQTNSPYTSIKIKGASTYGVNVDFHVDSETAVQFIYTYTSSRVTINDYYNPGSSDFSNISENYYLLGGVRYFGRDNIQPYGSFNIGAAYYNLTNIDTYYSLNSSDALRFAIGFGLGLKFMFTERIGLDLHVRCLAPLTFGGVGVGIGTGGASAGVYAGSNFISGDVGGGLVIRLGN